MVEAAGETHNVGNRLRTAPARLAESHRYLPCFSIAAGRHRDSGSTAWFADAKFGSGGVPTGADRDPFSVRNYMLIFKSGESGMLRCGRRGATKAAKTGEQANVQPVPEF